MHNVVSTEEIKAFKLLLNKKNATNIRRYMASSNSKISYIGGQRGKTTYIVLNGKPIDINEMDEHYYSMKLNPHPFYRHVHASMKGSLLSDGMFCTDKDEFRVFDEESCEWKEEALV